MRLLKLLILVTALVPLGTAQAGADDALSGAYAEAQEAMESAPSPEADYMPDLKISPEVRATTRRLANYEKCILGLFYSTRLNEQASVVNGYPLSVGYDPVLTAIVNLALAQNYGITMGREMYFPPDRLDTRTPWGMTWLAHEMRHVVQFDEFGSKGNFLQAYTASVGAGMLNGDSTNEAYRNSLFEKDARSVESAFSDLLNGEPALASALAGPGRDKAVCELVGANRDAYKSRISGKLGTFGQRTLKLYVGTLPFIKQVTYTFYTEN